MGEALPPTGQMDCGASYLRALPPIATPLPCAMLTSSQTASSSWARCRAAAPAGWRPRWCGSPACYRTFPVRAPQRHACACMCMRVCVFVHGTRHYVYECTRVWAPCVRMRHAGTLERRQVVGDGGGAAAAAGVCTAAAGQTGTCVWAPACHGTRACPPTRIHTPL
jgi:hypothetical protein